MIPQNSRIKWLALASAVFVFHLAFGVYYAIHLGAANWRPSLKQSGEDYLHSFPGWDTNSEQDAAGLNRGAMSILQRGLPYSRQGAIILRTAVYSYFLAGCYALAGVRLLPVALAQAVLSALTCALLAAAASRLSGGRNVAGWLAGGLHLMNLRVAMHVSYVSPLILTLFFTAVALWGVVWWTKRTSVGWIVASLVLATYTSSTFFVVALAAAAWLLFRRASAVGAALIVLFVTLKFVATWSNIGGASPEVNRAGDRGRIFWNSNNPYYDRMRPWSLWEWRGSNPWSTWQATAEEQARHESYLARTDHNELRAALLWIRENPGRYLQVCLARLRTEFGPYTGQMSPRNRLISTIVWLLIFPAGFYGLWNHRREPAAQFVVLAVVAVFGFGTIVTEELYLRYRMPVDLMLTAFAGLAYAEHFCRAGNLQRTAM